MAISVPENLYIYDADLTGIPFQYCFRYPETIRYFTDTPHRAELSAGRPQAFVTEEMLFAWTEAGKERNSYAEYCLSCMPVSELLLSYERCVFHAVALRWRERAYLISAGSGVGKSTQCSTLTKYWPREFSVINGDKPILEYRQDGSILVHPSPWNGKEGWHGAEAAPLAGLFFLRRGEQNDIRSLLPHEAAALAFRSVFQSYSSSSIIRRAGSFCEKLLESCPVWLLTSHQVPDSTGLLYRTLCGTGEKGKQK